MHDSTPSFRLSERAAISVMAQSGHLDASSRMSASLIGRLGSSAFRLSTNSSVDVAHGLALLFGLGTKGPSIMGFEDEVEQSFGRPCRQYDGRFKRTYELKIGRASCRERV